MPFILPYGANSATSLPLLLLHRTDSLQKRVNVLPLNEADSAAIVPHSAGIFPFILPSGVNYATILLLLLLFEAASAAILPRILSYESNSATILPLLVLYESDSTAILPPILPYESHSATVLPLLLLYEADSAAILPLIQHKNVRQHVLTRFLLPKSASTKTLTHFSGTLRSQKARQRKR